MSCGAGGWGGSVWTGGASWGSGSGGWSTSWGSGGGGWSTEWADGWASSRSGCGFSEGADTSWVVGCPWGIGASSPAAGLTNHQALHSGALCDPNVTALERGYAEEEARVAGGGGEILDFLRLLPNKDWVPFGSFELEPHQGVFGVPGGAAVEFYLKPSLMPVGGFSGWKAHPVYHKDLAFARKDNIHEVRLNKEIATRWMARELLAFSEVRGAEFDVANVITTVHRIAKASDRWFVKRDPRLRQVLARAVDALCDRDRRSTARDVAKTQWAMGRLKHCDRPVQERLAEEVARRLSDLQPQGLSNILWSYAYTGAPQQGVLDAVIGEFGQKLPSCDPQALGNVSWSLAKLLVLDCPLLARISSETMRKAEGFDPQGLANMAWAFATLQQEDAPLFDCLGETLACDPTRWQPQNLANLLWAFAKLLVTHNRLLDAVAKETAATVDNWNFQGLANISWAYAKLGCVEYQYFFDRIAATVVQKIRTFTPQNTVNIAWAYAKMSLATVDLMEAIAEDVVIKCKDYNPQHCSNAAWAFGTVGILNEPMMESLAGAVGRHASEFNGQDLANMAWACAKLVWVHEGLLDAVAGEARAKASGLTPQNAAITAWSFGCLAITHEPMIAAIAGDFCGRVAEFGPQGLANFAHGFAKQGVLNEVAMDRIAQEAARTICNFTNQEFSMTAWAFAKLGLSPQSLIDAIIAEMKVRMSDLIPQDLAMLAWSFAHFESTKSKCALEEISWEVMKQAVYLGPQDLTNICWAYATAEVENAMMMHALAQEVLNKINSFTAQDLSNTSWAFAKLGLTEDDMFDAISLEVVRKVGLLLPQNLSIISWAYAKLGLLNEDMMEAIAGEVLSKVDDFDGQGLANVVWSFAVLGLRRHEKTCSAAVERALGILEQLTTQEIANIAWGLTVLHFPGLLRHFLPRAVGHFLSTVGPAEGASCVDLANAAAQLAASGSSAGPDTAALEGFFRHAIFEPVLAKLCTLRDSNSDLTAAIAGLQEVLDATGAPYLGGAYTRDALPRLKFPERRAKAAWVHEARRCCREVIGEWRIPSRHSIVTYASWDVRRCDNALVVEHLQEPGRVFLSGWSEGIAVEVKELLHPCTQATRCDMHSERVALLELLDMMLKRAPERPAPGPGYDAVLSSYSGAIYLYLTHFPSLSSLGVFCQFMRRCQWIWLTFDFDDAWQTCCGAPRFKSEAAGAG